MEINVADELTKLVVLLEGHPFASIGGLIIILLILGFQKDGLFSKAFGFLEARSIQESKKEERRLEMMRMLYDRSQPEIPGLEQKDEEMGQ